MMFDVAEATDDSIELISANEKKTVTPLTIRIISEAVCNHYGIRHQLLMTKKRSNTFVEARHTAIYLANKLMPEKAYAVIGRAFKRDHTTIGYSIQRVKELIEKDREYAEVVIHLENIITNRATNLTLQQQVVVEAIEDLTEVFRKSLMKMAMKDPAEFIRRCRRLVE